MRSFPVLIISDGPDHHTGLARIGRDLATLMSGMPEIECGYLGRGGVGKRKFPWTSYSYPEAHQWGEDYLPQVWLDFSAGRSGAVFSLWDASRMLWFGQPHTMQQANPELAKFLGDGRTFAKWGYFPVDGTGPNEQGLPVGMASAVSGYNRVLAASEWGRCVLQASGCGHADWLPHGIWFDVFKPSERAWIKSRGKMGWEPEDIWLGCNMSNQARKDWPVAFECAQVLKQNYGNRFHFWAHTDRVQHYWNLLALAIDYGVADCLEITLALSDEQLALRYSACDCTILPSAGEGFGYPIAESLACGTACIVADYAAGQELVPEECKALPIGYKVETMHNVRRAVLSGYLFAQKALAQIEAKRRDWEYRSEELRAGVDFLDWQKLQHPWKKWLLAGVPR